MNEVYDYGVWTMTIASIVFFTIFAAGFFLPRKKREWPTLLTLLMFPILVDAYVHLAKKETKELAERFGEQYKRYGNLVPAFIPIRPTAPARALWKVEAGDLTINIRKEKNNVWKSERSSMRDEN